MPIIKPDEINFESMGDLHQILLEEGCRACSLGFQEGLNGCCVSRGNYLTKRMIIGEAPGKYEDAQSEPFVGPAGQLLNKILDSVGFNHEEDFYITNVVLCRPIAAKGSGKENYTPRQEQRNKCRPYLEAQIRMISPLLIVPLGKPATEAILGVKGIRMGNYRGKAVMHKWNPWPENVIGSTWNIWVFPMLHPAAILHARSQPEKHRLYREQTWEDIQNLKKLIEEKGL
jgi:uracil-DNA glycosylase family 4